MDGVLIINKPAGMTSHDVVNRLRKKYGQKKFGHTGTLDPEASGVLVVLAGRAVKLLQFLQDTDKEYTASIALGSKTNTGDIWGNVLETRPVNTDFDFARVLESFKGPQRQKVPAYSAKKVNGKKLYELAREGKEVPEVFQDVVISEIEPVEEDNLSFHVRCSSGTYIRSICEEFGEKTGNLAAMSSLVRTKASGFSLSQAEDLDAESHTIYPMESVLNLPEIEYEPIEDIKNGKHVRMETPEDRVLITHDGKAVAVYDRHHGQIFSCTRGLWA